jgi:hypothetical protein
MITFHTKSGLVTFTELEVAPDTLQSAGDRRYSLQISFSRLKLSGHTFWVAKDDWHSFANAAVKVLQRRVGTASFRSMSPGSCQLVIEPIKNKRELKLTVNINELAAGRADLPKFATFIEDELDSEFLLDLENHLK